MPASLFVTPLVHPAAITRGRWNIEEAQEAYLRRLAPYIKEGREPPVWDVTQAPPGACLYPDLGDLNRWSLQLDGTFDAVVYDLETTGDFIICVGMVPLDLVEGTMGWPLCLRFRRQGGARYWPTPTQHLAAVEWLASHLDDPALGSVFHNGTSFDVPLLVKHGFRLRGPIVDTMVMSSRAYAEMPKGLQFLATRYLWAPVWKTLTDPDDEMEGKA